MDNKYQPQSCDACEEDLRKETEELVQNVEGYTDEDRHAKQKEVEAAFAESSAGNGKSCGCDE